MQVVSRWCHCIVQRLCATDCKRPCLVRAAAPHSARHGRRACMPKCSMQGRIQVVEQSRCRTHRQQTTTIAQMQSQPSIHSPSPRGRGLGLGIENKHFFGKTDFFYSLRIIRLDFLFKLWYNSTVSEIEPVIMGVSPVQGSPVNHVRRGTEQH